MSTKKLSPKKQAELIESMDWMNISSGFRKKKTHSFLLKQSQNNIEIEWKCLSRTALCTAMR